MADLEYRVDAETGEVLQEFDPAALAAWVRRQSDGPWVSATLETEDLRALLARCLVFTDSGRDAPLYRRHVRLEVGARWMRGTAMNGYAGCSQRVECDADGLPEPGAACTFVLSDFDAAMVLRTLPRPSANDSLGPVSVRFELPVEGADPSDSLAVQVEYRALGRVWRYEARQVPGMEVPDVMQLVSPPPPDAEPVSRVALDPRLTGLVSAAAKAARDQEPGVVRWYLVPQVSLPEPVVVATFGGVVHEDEFVAVLLPVASEWPDGQPVAGAQARHADLWSEGARRARQERLPLDGGDS